MKSITVIGLLLASATLTAYVILNYTRVDSGVKWWLFDIHLLTACLGVLANGVGVAKRRWLCLIGGLVCFYFVYIQLLSGMIHRLISS
jgi:hypothetical protein